MDELGENLLLAPNEQVCLLFDQHDALKVKEEMEIPREDIMMMRYHHDSSSASSSPNSSLTPSPQRDLSPPSSSESCEEYLHFSNPAPASIVTVDDDSEDDVKEEDDEDISRGYMTNFMKNGNINMNDNALFSAQQQSDKQRKRKRVNKVTFVGETNIMWEDYIPTESPVLLFQDNQILNFGMCVTHMDKTICPASDVSNAYILYKQNQFKLCCKLAGVLQAYSTMEPNSKFNSLNVVLSGELLPLEGLYFHIYAVKHAGDKLDNLTPVPLHQAGPSRTKKEMKPVQPAPINNGSSLFAKLQFQSSTPAGKEFFFRIIACLVAKTVKGSHMLMAKISPKLIVRAQNPGRYSVAGQDAHNTVHYNHGNSSGVQPPSFAILTSPVATGSGNIPFIPPPPTSRSNSPTANLIQLKQNPSPTGSQQPTSAVKLTTTPTNGLSPHPYQTPSPEMVGVTSGTSYHSTHQSFPPTQTQSHPQGFAHHPAQSLPPHTQTQTHAQTHMQTHPQTHTQAHPHPHTQTHTHTHPHTPYQPQPYPTQPYSPTQNAYPAPYGSAPPTHYQSTPVLPTSDPTYSSHNPPPPATWRSGPNDVSYHFGRVGINTSIPPEALTVQGNILLTGDLLKPSDRRIKRNLRSVSGASQLKHIENIKIYDYEVRTDEKGNYKNERGVIAQELKDVIPEAVETITPLHTDLGESMYIVNDRVLLIESLGATKQLDKIVKQEQAALQYVNKKVKELEEQENRAASAISRTVQSVVDIIMSEDFRETSDNECLYCGTSIMGLGPAWTLFIIGFFFFPAWILGTLYLGSKLRSKKMAGLANFLMLCSLVLVIVSFGFYADDVVPRLAAAVVILMVAGILLVYTISYFRDRRRRLEQSVWKRLRGLRGEQQPQAPEPQPVSHSPSPSPVHSRSPSPAHASSAFSPASPPPAFTTAPASRTRTPTPIAHMRVPSPAAASVAVY